MEKHGTYSAITIESEENDVEDQSVSNNILYPKTYEVTSGNPAYDLIRQIPLIMVAGLIIGVAGTFLYRRLS